jgi:hypothetical protein
VEAASAGVNLEEHAHDGVALACALVDAWSPSLISQRVRGVADLAHQDRRELVPIAKTGAGPLSVVVAADVLEHPSGNLQEKLVGCAGYSRKGWAPCGPSVDCCRNRYSTLLRLKAIPFVTIRKFRE